jgi:hypothetical protein
MDKFDWIFYLNRYPELFDLKINTYDTALKHWKDIGENEGRLINNIQIKPNNIKINKQIDKFDNIKTFKILTSKLIESIAINIKNILNSLNINVIIIYELVDEDEDSNDYYIIIYNNFSKSFLPKNYILYIIEQETSSFFTDKNYLNMIKNAKYIWDFRINKIDLLEYPLSKYYYLTCPFLYTSNKNLCEPIYDIFFFGTQNDRRTKILEKISKKYKVIMGFSVSGNEKEEYIKKSKIILNLHYYKDVMLETCRINEILNYNKIIISELPVKKDWYNVYLYKDSIIFIDEIKDDLSNIDVLYKQIDKYLNNYQYNKKINETINYNKIISNKSEFNLKKLLLPLNIGIDNKINYNLIPNKIYCLNLIEESININNFMNQQFKPDVEIFLAIKYDPLWIGNALSYINLIYNAKRGNLFKITICEDSYIFKNDFNEKYIIINEALNILKNKWDIFNGYIDTISTDIICYNIYKYKEMIFLEINNLTNNVFNIYNNTCYDAIINWNFNDINTIDKYIQSQKLKILIAYSFDFSNNESLKIITNIIDNHKKPIINI